VVRGADKEDSRGRVIRNVARFIHRDLPKGGHLEDIASLHELGLRCCHADDLPRRETAGAALDALSNYKLSRSLSFMMRLANRLSQSKRRIIQLPIKAASLSLHRDIETRFNAEPAASAAPMVTISKKKITAQSEPTILRAGSHCALIEHVADLPARVGTATTPAPPVGAASH
jgi:hypothetical protein